MLDEIFEFIDEHKKMFIAGFVFLVILGIIVSIATSRFSDTTIHFKEDLTIEYGSEVNTISLIESVGNRKLSEDDYDYKNNRIILRNWEVTGETINTNALGKYQVKFTTSDLEDNIYTITVEVVDTIPPEINIKKTEIEIDEDEIGELDLESNYSVTDNYSELRNIYVVYEPRAEALKIGKNIIKIVAQDENGNTSEKQFTVIVNEIIIEEPEPEPPSTPSGNNNSSGGSTTTQPQQPSTPAPQPSVPSGSPVVKDFLFSAGYDMSTAPQACAAELSASGRSGSCTPLQDADGIYYGMRLTLN